MEAVVADDKEILRRKIEALQFAERMGMSEEEAEAVARVAVSKVKANGVQVAAPEPPAVPTRADMDRLLAANDSPEGEELEAPHRLRKAQSSLVAWQRSGLGGKAYKKLTDSCRAEIKVLYARGWDYIRIAQWSGIKQEVIRAAATRLGLHKPEPHKKSKKGKGL